MHEQSTGIRQGCPLSPYLFLVVMTCLFHDVHTHHTLDEDLRAGRVPGQTEDEILYADDTICASTSKIALEKLLHAIEEESEKYGLKLNETKCEIIQFGQQVTLKFRHGAVVPHMHKVKYLGCLVNDRGDPQMELRHRLSVCMGVWKKLGLFFKSSDCSVRLKLQVFNAILRSKLMYGLESAQLTESSRQRLGTFQLKGLRQILKITTTYVDRQHSNTYVYTRANEQLQAQRHEDRIERLSEYYTRMKLKSFAAILASRDDDPVKTVLLNPTTLKQHDVGTLRVGRPKKSWYRLTLSEYWKAIGKSYDVSVAGRPLNLEDNRHVALLKQAARAGFH